MELISLFPERRDAETRRVKESSEIPAAKAHLEQTETDALGPSAHLVDVFQFVNDLADDRLRLLVALRLRGGMKPFLAGPGKPERKKQQQRNEKKQ